MATAAFLSETLLPLRYRRRALTVRAFLLLAMTQTR
jgi:hypothetical protein